MTIGMAGEATLVDCKLTGGTAVADTGIPDTGYTFEFENTGRTAVGDTEYTFEFEAAGNKAVEDTAYTFEFESSGYTATRKSKVESTASTGCTAVGNNTAVKPFKVRGGFVDVVDVNAVIARLSELESKLDDYSTACGENQKECTTLKSSNSDLENKVVQLQKNEKEIVSSLNNAECTVKLKMVNIPEVKN